MAQLPCDSDGLCMRCKEKPPSSQTLSCRTCATPWHISCLTAPPVSVSDLHWDCPDCSDLCSHPPVASSDDIVSSIRAIQADESLSDQQKAKRCQELLAGSSASSSDPSKDKTADIFDDSFSCSICMQLPDRPVTVCSSSCSFFLGQSIYLLYICVFFFVFLSVCCFFFVVVEDALWA